MTQDEAKALVGKQAAALVEPGMAVGLGTGSTSTQFIRALAARNTATPLNLRCVASSDASAALGSQLGLDVTTLEELPELDLYIDGADEVARMPGAGLALIKGGGAALLREKIVASSSKKFIVVVDSSKIVAQLGKFPLPVEVIKMARPLVERHLTALGLNPVLRLQKNSTEPLLTDENNYILDCHCGSLPDPAKTAEDIRNIVGVVEHGLFLNMASLTLIAGDNGVTEMHP
jgi:ribose 5-phosphate isomerase A